MIRSERDVLIDLLLPFPLVDVSWKPGALNKVAKEWQRGKPVDWRAPKSELPSTVAMTYADLRAYQRRLDKACGLNWTVRYVPWGDKRIICEITITVSISGEPVQITRSGTGEYDEGGKDAPEGTAAEAQAFKRACAMFGLGRYLYDTASTWTGFDPNTRTVTPEGKKELERVYLTRYAEVVNGLANAGFLTKEQTQELLMQVRGKTQPAPQTQTPANAKPAADAPVAKTQPAPAETPAAAPTPTTTAAPSAESKPGTDATGNVWELWTNTNDARAYGKANGMDEKEVAVAWSDSVKEAKGFSASNHGAFKIFYQKVQEKKNG